MTITRIFAICSLAIGLSISANRGAVALQTERVVPSSGGEPSLARTAAPLPSDGADFRGRYSPTYRTNPPSYRVNPLYPPGPRSGLGPTSRLRPGYRFAFPLDRYRAASPPPYYYRRMTPYYDGRGYGVPSTSPFRYHRDLDGPIGPRRGIR